MTTYKPIAEAGIPFTFSVNQSSPVMAGSTVSADTPLPGPSWSIAFDDGVARNVRVTIGPYSSQRVQGSELPSYFEFAVGEDPPVRVTNEILESAEEFVPSPILARASGFAYQAGFGSELFRNEMYRMLVEVEPDRGACGELGRVTRAFVSGYTRARVHDTRVYPGERRCLVANFHGAIAKGESIDQVVWRMDPVYAVAMADPSIEGREARVMIRACYSGEAAIKCEARLSNGEAYIQLFRVKVIPGPYFGDEFTAAGPAMLQVDA